MYLGIVSEEENLKRASLSSGWGTLRGGKLVKEVEEEAEPKEEVVSKSMESGAGGEGKW